MGIECQILLQDPEEGVFRPGEVVAGTLHYFINKPKKVQSIDISFIGKGRCRWLESKSGSDSSSDSDDEATYSNEEEYINITKNLFNPGGDEEILVSGVIDYPFEFLLPDNIPTSMKNRNCTIEYKVIATFVKNSEKKKTFEEEVTVYGYVDPCSPEPLAFGLQREFSSPTAVNSFNVKAEIDRTFVTPGENFTLTLKVENNADIPITVEAEIIKYFTYITAATGQETKVHIEALDDTRVHSPPIKEKSEMNLKLIVPTLPSLYSIQHSKILIGEYKVRLMAKVPLSHIITAKEVPVVIGEKKDNPPVDTQGIEEDPPSYSP